MSDSAHRAVVLSYASQDVAAALRICAALRAAGTEVWFDPDALVGGDAWDQSIRGQILLGALFMPVISAATPERLEGCLRIKWKLAEEPTHAMAATRAFWRPIVIDATRDADAHVSAEFRAVQGIKLPGGEFSASFMAPVQKLLGGPEVARAFQPGGLEDTGQETRAPVGRPLRGRLPWFVGAAAGLGLLATLGREVCLAKPHPRRPPMGRDGARRPPRKYPSCPP